MKRHEIKTISLPSGNYQKVRITGHISGEAAGAEWPLSQLIEPR